MHSADHQADRFYGKKILVIAPLMHRQGHFMFFPQELALGFKMNQASVTLLHPFRTAETPMRMEGIKDLCLEDRINRSGKVMRLLWRAFAAKPHVLCLAWLTLHVRPGTYDLAYWSDFEPDNQQSVWPLGLLAFIGLYRHRTAFTEHHDFNWSRHRWQRLLRLDRIRLHRIEMFVHSQKLLDWIRLNMVWPEKGHYVEHGLWRDPATDAERAAARNTLGIPVESRVLLVFGMQAIRRKEIDTLAKAIGNVQLDKPLVILFAGMKVKDEPHPFNHPDLARKANLLVRHHESFIADDMVKTFFASADAVWAYYGAFLGASGVLAQAIAFGRIPICAHYAESGDLCQRLKVGVLTPTDNLAGVQAVLDRFLSMPNDEQAALESASRKAALTIEWPNMARKIMEIML